MEKNMKELEIPSDTVKQAIELFDNIKEHRKEKERLMRMVTCHDCPILEDWYKLQKEPKDCCKNITDDKTYLVWMVLFILGFLILVTILLFA